MLCVAAALAACGGVGRPPERPYCCGVRGWPGRVLAGTLSAGARDRDTCDPFDEHSGPADAPASKERPARHRTSEAELPWLAARRAWALHDGAGADAVGGGRAAAEPGAFEPDRRDRQSTRLNSSH